MLEGGELRPVACASTRRGGASRPSGCGPGRGDAPGPDEPRRRDRPGRRGRRRRADRDAGAPASSCGWRCSTTCSPTARSPVQAAAIAGGGVMLDGRTAASENLVVRARVSSIRSRIDEVLTVTRGRRRDQLAHRARQRVGTASCSRRVRRPARPPPDARAARTRRRSPRHAAAAAGGYCAILAMPNTDPVVDSAAVLGALVEAAQRRGRDPGRVPRGDHEGPGGRRADGDGRARRRRRRRGFTDDGRPVVSAGLHAARAPVRRRRGRKLALHCEDPTLSRGATSTRRGLGRARLRRLSLARGERDGGARPRARRVRAAAAAPASPLGAGVGRRAARRAGSGR